MMAPRVFIIVGVLTSTGVVFFFSIAIQNTGEVLLEERSTSTDDGIKNVDAKCVPSGLRTNCGWPGITKKECSSLNCCWYPIISGGGDAQDDDQAWCFQYNKLVPGYRVVQVIDHEDKRYVAGNEKRGKSGWDMSLELIEPSHDMYGPDVKRLNFTVELQTKERIRVTIRDEHQQRYEVAETLLPLPVNENIASNEALYSFSYTQSPFGFAVTRKSDGMVLVNTSAVEGGVFGGLIYEDNYIELSTQLPETPNIYGLGERVHKFRLDATGKTYTLWTRDGWGTHNTYGYHPFYTEVRDGKAHGVFLRASHGMEVDIYPGFLRNRLLGGIVDMFIVVGPEPETVVKQYSEIIGKPHMPPYFSLGWHQCRWGLNTVNETAQVVANYSVNKLPLDTIWNDIDYMDGFRDFTFAPDRFPLEDVQSMVEQLHKQSQHYVVIVDPGIKNESGYFAFDRGLELDVYVKDSDGEPFAGRVWPGDVVFPDFLAPNATQFWNEMISGLLERVPIDGLWIDMNEASNFCDGSCTKRHTVLEPSYRVNNGGRRLPLNDKTLDMTATHNEGRYIEYQVHNMYGHSEAIATSLAFEKARGTRSLVISRSTFAGSGSHTGHWLGDNMSTFAAMACSIAGALNMNVFGIPLVGADVCGFSGNATMELCARFHTLGAFFPFARNHNDISAPDQYPYTWPIVAEGFRWAATMKYSLLPYYNTLFYNAHVDGGTVMRPLLFEFPADEETLHIDHQFMIGSAILLSPCVTEGATTVPAYFPSAKWYDFESGELISDRQAQWLTLDAPLTSTQIHIRGGFVVPRQRPGLTTAASRQNPFEMLIALDENGEAHGLLFLDDGETLDVGAEATVVQYAVSKGRLSTRVKQASYYGSQNVQLAKVVVYGVQEVINTVTVNGHPVNFAIPRPGVLQADVEPEVGARVTRENFCIEWSANGLQANSSFDLMKADSA